MGYVGGRIAQALAVSDRFDLVLGSRVARPSPVWVPGARVLPMDWISLESLQVACDGVDAIVHCAGMNDAECLRDPVAALEVNGVNTVRLLEAAKACGVERFIYLSTVHVYGAPLVGRIDEASLPCARHPYASSHRAAEDAVLAAGPGMAGIVLRLSNGFGVPAHPDVDAWTLLVNDLCRQAVIDRGLSLRSAGLQRRDFVTLHDIGRVVAHFLEVPAALIGHGIFNVGGGHAMRIIDMAHIIQARCQAVLGFAPQIIRPQPALDETSPELDYRIARLLATGFVLKGDIHDEIDATLRLCAQIFQ